MNDKEWWEGWTCPKCGFEPDNYGAFCVHKYQRHEIDSGDKYIERYRRIKKEIPDKYNAAYEALTASGKGPKTVQAAVAYIEGGGTQDDVSKAFDTSVVAIRNMVWELIDRKAVTLEEVRENNFQNGFQQFGEKRCEGEKSV